MTQSEKQNLVDDCFHEMRRCDTKDLLFFKRRFCNLFDDADKELASIALRKAAELYIEGFRV